MTPELQNALKTITTALEGAPAGPAAPAADAWWKPTDAQTMTFSKRIGWSVHDLTGNRQANGSPTAPKIPACDGSTADAKLYAAFGFEADGTRALWEPADRTAAEKLGDRLFAAPSVPAIEAVVVGAGGPGVETDLAIYLVKTGLTVGGGLGGSLRLYNLGWTSIDSYLANPTGGGGQAGTFGS